MGLIVWIAITCTIAGFVMMLAGYRLASDSKTNIDATVKAEVIKDAAKNSTTANIGADNTLEPQSFDSPLQLSAEYVKALAELAKSLKDLTPGIASFIIATILFFFAAILAIVDRLAGN